VLNGALAGSGGGDSGGMVPSGWPQRGVPGRRLLGLASSRRTDEQYHRDHQHDQEYASDRARDQVRTVAQLRKPTRTLSHDLEWFRRTELGACGTPIDKKLYMPR
jgi:hypothetical protein